MQFNIYNFCLSLCALSLPFMQALTINVGFPLKLYEAVIMFLLGYILCKHKFRFSKANTFETYLVFILLIALLVSVLLNGFISANSPAHFIFPSRFGQFGDSIMKLIYAVLVFTGFIVIINDSSKNTDSLINFWLLGAILSATYSWYLVIFSILNKDIFLLPGIYEPQYINVIAFRPIMRMGTFLEGNFAGLFFFLSTVLAYQAKNKFKFIYLSLSTITTFSTVAIILTLCFNFYAWITRIKELSLPLKIFNSTILLISFIATISALYSNPVTNTLIFKKIFAADNEHWSGSRKERVGQSTAGINMLKDNMLFGVGLSQYGYFYDTYKDINAFEVPGDIKRIPNNVYVEILSENGLVTFLFFVLFLARIFLRLTKTNNYILRAGLVGMLIYFLFFPTFSIMYIWFYFGIAINKSHTI